MKRCKKCDSNFEPSPGLINYCSLICRNSRSWSEEDKKKKSDARFSFLDKNNLSVKERECPSCFKTFKPRNNKTQFCSIECYGNSELAKQTGSEGGKISASLKIKRSKNEILFYQLCKEHFNNVEHNKPIFNGWDADIIIHDLKLAILWNGKWHYEKITNAHSLEQVQNRDKIKQKEIEAAGYQVYEIKDMGRHNEKFVDERFRQLLSAFV